MRGAGRGARSTTEKRQARASASSSATQASIAHFTRAENFETPVSAARDTIRSGTPRDGKDALYSTGPRQSGTVVVSCTKCKARTRINLTDLGLRWLGGTVWIPGRKNGHWMRCPACGARTWCSIGWQE